MNDAILRNISWHAIIDKYIVIITFLSSFGGLGVSSVFGMVTDGSAFLGTGSTLGLATGVSAGVAMGLLLANSS